MPIVCLLAQVVNRSSTGPDDASAAATILDLIAKMSSCQLKNRPPISRIAMFIYQESKLDRGGSR
jgi:hypothetical protein